MLQFTTPGTGPGHRLSARAEGTLYRRPRLSAAVVEPLEPRRLLASAELLADLNPMSRVSLVSEIVEFNGALFFAARDVEHGGELWTSDGTEAGTRLFAETTPGVAHPPPIGLTPGGDFLYFNTLAGLWRTDGTPDGTVFLKPVGLVNAAGHATLDGVLYFVGNEKEAGNELWRSDGTPDGTYRVRDVNSGPAGSYPANLVAFDGALYFSAASPSTGIELWRSDGTEAGTVLLKDIFTGNRSASPGPLVAFEGALYFSATGAEGDRVWKTDGTADGTVRFLDFDGEHLTVFGGKLYFTGPSPWHFVNGLWQSDGTADGTARVMPQAQPEPFTAIGELVATDRALFFPVWTPGIGWRIWSSDGSADGARPIESVQPWHDALEQFKNLTPDYHGGALYFTRGDAGPLELWRTDADGRTVRLHELHINRRTTMNFWITPALGRLFFLGHDREAGHELWSTDGTSAGTSRVKDIDTATQSSHARPPYRTDHLAFYTFHHGEDYESTHGFAATDGSPEGTRVVAPFGGRPLAHVGDTLYFTGNDGVHGIELWKSDGTPEGTVLVKDAVPGAAGLEFGSTQAVIINGILYFVAREPVLGSVWKLWRSDGTPEGTFPVHTDVRYAQFPSYQLAAAGEKLVFVLSQQLWTSDGTPGGTSLVFDRHPVYGNFVDGDGFAFMTVYDPQFGVEVWRTDGTPGGTWRVSDVHPDPAAHTAISGFVRAGDQWFFLADDGVHGKELWRTDGTSDGTRLVKDVRPGAGAGPIDVGMAAGGLLFFSADDGVHGGDLWRSDGTPEGTFLLIDGLAGAAGGFTQTYRLARLGDLIVAEVRGPFSATRLYRSDGTREGTFPITDALPGSVNFTEVAGVLYFDSAGAGWRTDGSRRGTFPIGAIGTERTAVNGSLVFRKRDPVFGEELFTVRPLVLTGTGGDDVFTVRRDAATDLVHVSLNDGPTPVATMPLASLNRIDVSGGDGDDTLVIDFTGGTLLSADGITFDAGAGVNRLRVVGDDAAGGAIQINAGSVTIDTDLNGARLVAIGDASLQFGASQRLTSLVLRDAARARMAPDASLLDTAELLIDRDAALDLDRSGVILHASPATREGILDYLASRARNQKLRASQRPHHGLAMATGGDAIIVKNTYNGDANLDGRVNADDYFRIDLGFLSQPRNPRYAQGDFNYDGKIDVDDYFIIDQAFVGQAAPLTHGSPPLSSSADTGPRDARRAARAPVARDESLFLRRPAPSRLRRR